VLPFLGIAGYAHLFTVATLKDQVKSTAAAKLCRLTSELSAGATPRPDSRTHLIEMTRLHRLHFMLGRALERFVSWLYATPHEGHGVASFQAALQPA
jgi:hypothetical protein